MKLRTFSALFTVVMITASNIAAYDFGLLSLTGATGSGFYSSLASGSGIDQPLFSSDLRASVESGMQRKYELREFDQLYAAGTYRWREYGIAAGVSQLGKSELYQERIAKVAVTREIQKLYLQVMLSGKSIKFGNDYGTFSAVTAGLGIGYSINRFQLYLAGDNLTRPTLYSGAKKEGLLLRGGANAQIGKSVAASVGFRYQQETTVRLSMAQAVVLSPEARLQLGLITAPLEYGGGLDFLINAIQIQYMAAIHPVLGFTHTIQIGYVWGRSKGDDPLAQ